MHLFASVLAELHSLCCRLCWQTNRFFVVASALLCVQDWDVLKPVAKYKLR